MRNCQIYNNTFYNSLEEGSNIWLYDHYPGFRSVTMYLYTTGRLLQRVNHIENEVFQGNLYWNLARRSLLFQVWKPGEWAEATGQERVEGEMCRILS